MKHNTIQAGIALCLTAFLVSACGAKSGTEEAAAAVIPVYGNPANLESGGLVEGSDEEFYYTWNGALIHASADGANRSVLDENGADTLCLTPETLYYVSYDVNRQRGIYALDRGASQRRLLLNDNASFLYAYDGRLYFLAGGAICSAKADGTDRQLLYEGSYRSLSLRDKILYAQNFDTAVIEQLALDGSGAAQNGQAEEPQIQTERSGTSEETQTQEERSDTAEETAAEQAQRWELPEGPSPDVSARLLGTAGKWLLYEERSYTPQSMTDTVRIPERIRLYAFDATAENNGQSQELLLLEEKTVSDAATWDADRFAAQQSFQLLLGQDKSMLRNEADGFWEALAREPEAVSWHITEEKEGYARWLLVNTAEHIYLFQSFWDGVYCAYRADRASVTALEPLPDGSFLRTGSYQNGGISLDAYDIIAFGGGCKLLVTDTYQHMQLQPEILLEQTGALLESSVKTNTYYAQGAFVTAEEWETALRQNIESRRTPPDWTAFTRP